MMHFNTGTITIAIAITATIASIRSRLGSSWMKARPSARPGWADRRSGRRSGKARAGHGSLPQNCLKRSWSSTKDLKTKLAGASLPAWWLRMVLAAATPALTQPVIAGVEVFSGRGHLTSAFTQYVAPWQSFELLDNHTQDILDQRGVTYLITLVLSIAVGGVLWVWTLMENNVGWVDGGEA